MSEQKNEVSFTPFRVPAAGKLLGVSPQTIRRHIKLGLIKSSKLGQHLIPAGEIARLRGEELK
jgi:hypothetical protein